MKVEQKIVATFAFLGFIFGVFSYLVNNLLFSTLIPLIFYLVCCCYFIKRKTKLKKEFFMDSFFSFFMVWIIVWLTLFNL